MKRKWKDRDRKRRKKRGQDMIIDNGNVRRIQGDLEERRKKQEREGERDENVDR